MDALLRRFTNILGNHGVDIPHHPDKTIDLIDDKQSSRAAAPSHHDSVKGYTYLTFVQDGATASNP
jgi:hypothetical protein